MTRGPLPPKALTEAIPIARARGIIQKAMSGPERIFDIAIISKIPVTFAPPSSPKFSLPKNAADYRASSSRCIQACRCRIPVPDPHR